MPVIQGSNISHVEGVAKAYMGYNLVYGSGSDRVDTSAQAFLTSAGITEPTASYAINQLVIDLKQNNLWNELDIFYPFVGSTTTAHTKNLINPDTWSLAFTGFPDEYSNNGLRFNGVNEYATITGMNPNTYPFWSGGDAMFGMTYNATGSAGTNVPVSGIFQASSATSGSSADNMAVMGYSARLGFDAVSTFSLAINTETYIVNRDLATNKTQTYQSGALLNENEGYAWNGGVRTTPYFLIGALRVKTNFDDSISNYNSARYTSYFFGHSLSSSQISTLNDIIVNFNTLMGRNTMS